MYLKEFKTRTGLSDSQIRRLCDKGLIPFNHCKGERRTYTEDSIAAAKKLFDPVSEVVYLGPQAFAINLHEVRALDYIPLNKKNATEFLVNFKKFLTTRRVEKLNIRLGFHVQDTSIASEICIFCLNQNISFEFFKNE